MVVFDDGLSTPTSGWSILARPEMPAAGAGTDMRC